MGRGLYSIKSDTNVADDETNNAIHNSGIVESTTQPHADSIKRRHDEMA